MLVYEHTRSGGQRLTYTILYEQGEYIIQRDGLVKKSVGDGIIVSITPHEATPELMLRMAIADIEILAGMEE
ncbi:MAG: hypothetical protein HYZ65_00640 [Burkholderiales bacterium]|nr:hypothetical protein [Burkholderiales bacterium]